MRTAMTSSTTSQSGHPVYIYSDSTIRTIDIFTFFISLNHDIFAEAEGLLLHDLKLINSSYSKHK